MSRPAANKDPKWWLSSLGDSSSSRPVHASGWLGSKAALLPAKGCGQSGDPISWIWWLIMYQVWSPISQQTLQCTGPLCHSAGKQHFLDSWAVQPPGTGPTDLMVCRTLQRTLYLHPRRTYVEPENGPLQEKVPFGNPFRYHVMQFSRGICNICKISLLVLGPASSVSGPACRSAIAF